MRSNHSHLTVLLILFTMAFSLIIFQPGRAQEGDDNGTLELGAQLFLENCAVCHGFDGQGRIGANLAKDWPSIQPNLRIKSAISNGIPGSLMPAWSQENGGSLTDPEIDAIVEYILNWQTGNFPIVPLRLEPYPDFTLEAPPGVSGDPNRGADLYDYNCATCHGKDGEGRIGATLAKDWPSIRPDLRIKSTVERGIEGTAMSAWSKDFGGPLFDDDINDIISYIMTWSTQPSSPTLAVASTPAPAPGEIDYSFQRIIVLVFILFVIIVIAAAIYLVYRKR
jgi:cytochrome c oxidase cbb3-type subunit 3